MKNASTTGATFVRTAGLLCFAGAIIGATGSMVTGFIPPAVSADSFSYPYTPAAFLAAQLVYTLNRGLLLVGTFGLAYSGAVETGLLGRSGLWISVAGMAALALCEVGAMTLAASPYSSPGTGFLEAAYGVATILIGVGMTLAGAAVARTGAWHGWRRYVTLACGAAVFVVVIPGISGSFVAGQLATTTWMLVFAALGWALHTGARVPHPASASVG